MAGKDKKKLSKKEQRELEKQNRIAKGVEASKINQDKQKAKLNANKSAEPISAQEKTVKIPQLTPRAKTADIPLRTADGKNKEAKIKNIDFNEFTLKITALSPLHLGSGQADVNVDAEIIHDEIGLPYFPAKRLKGLIYESALEVTEMNIPQWTGDNLRGELNRLFHHGQQGESQLIIPNLYLDNYESLKADWNYLQQAYPELFTPTDVLEQYTSLRYQTKIDRETGTAADTSLHNMRVVDEGQVFTGKIELLNGSKRQFELLALALKNLTFAGMKRTRGFGRIDCAMEQKGNDIRTPLIREVFKGGKN